MEKPQPPKPQPPKTQTSSITSTTAHVLLKSIEKLQTNAKLESRKELLQHKLDIYKELYAYLSHFNANLYIDDRNITNLFDSHVFRYNSDDSSLQVTESNLNFFKELC